MVKSNTRLICVKIYVFLICALGFTSIWKLIIGVSNVFSTKWHSDSLDASKISCRIQVKPRALFIICCSGIFNACYYLPILWQSLLHLFPSSFRPIKLCLACAPTNFVLPPPILWASESIARCVKRWKFRCNAELGCNGLAPFARLGMPVALEKCAGNLDKTIVCPERPVSVTVCNGVTFFLSPDVKNYIIEL